MLFRSNYTQLLVFRSGVGVGEGGLQPAANSMIRDAFPPERRGRAFGIYNMGPMVGIGLALFIGGWLLKLSESGAIAHWPYLGLLKPWQFVLVVPGLAGLLLAALMLTLREPARAGAPPVASGGWAAYREALAHLRAEWRLYLPLWAAATLYAMAMVGFTSWLPTVIARTWHLAPADIGRTLGPLVMFSPALGLIVLGIVMDRLTKRGHRAAPLEVGMVSIAVAWLIFLALSRVDNLYVAGVLYACQAFLASPILSSASATMAQITSGRVMGKLTSIFFLVQSLLGVGLGPTIAVLIADHVYGGGPGALRYGVITLYAVCLILIALLYALLAPRVRNRSFE